MEKPSAKTLRMTAIDTDGHVKVYLVMARPDDITQLYKHLSERVKRAKECKQNTNYEVDNEVDIISPVKVRIVDTSLEMNNIDENALDGGNMSTNSETGEVEPRPKAVPVPVALSAISTVSACSSDSDLMNLLGDSEPQSQEDEEGESQSQ